jgi:DNA-binding NarL/FixJ family response regulator
LPASGLRNDIGSADIRIVIAEDHAFFRDGLRRALESQRGVRVVAQASDGAAALDAIQSLTPDVAILDIGLPEIDGCALARRIRQARLRVELIFLTICDGAVAKIVERMGAPKSIIATRRSSLLR